MPPQFENNNVPPTNIEKYGRDPSILIILIIVMILSGTGAVWYILNLPPEPTPQPITKVDQSPDTTNWKTYQNEELGFEMRIPSNWTTDIQKEVIYLFYSPNKTVQELTFYLGNPEVQILNREEIRKVNSGDLNWIVYKLEGSTSYEYELSKNGKIYVFSPSENLDIIPILSTFKFTK